MAIIPQGTEVGHNPIRVQEGMCGGSKAIRPRISDDLPTGVDAISRAICSAQCTEVLHESVGVQECMFGTAGRISPPDDLPAGVDALGSAPCSAQGTEVLYNPVGVQEGLES